MRTAIPTNIKREVLAEAGYSCAVPTWQKTDNGYEKSEGFRYQDSSAVRALARMRKRRKAS